MRISGAIVEYFSVAWHEVDLPEGLRIGDSASQTGFEYLVLVLAASIWCGPPTVILGDNTGALQCAIDLKGKGLMLILSRALAVLRARKSFVVTVGHLASEHNDHADALSRLCAPEEDAKPFPAGLDAAVRRLVPGPMALLRELGCAS